MWLFHGITYGVGIGVYLVLVTEAVKAIWNWLEGRRQERGERANELLKIRAAELMNEAEKLRQAQLFKVNFRRADDESEQ